MDLKSRLENALRIANTIENNELDYKNLYDLQLHISEALEQSEKVNRKVAQVRLDSLKVGETYKYNPKDVGIFKVLAKDEENWIKTIRTQSGRVTGGFPWDDVYPWPTKVNA